MNKRSEKGWLIFEQSPDAILLLDSEYTVVLSNPASHLLSGLDEHSLNGKSIQALIPALRLEGISTAISKNALPKPYTTHYELIHSTGRMVPVEISICPQEAAGYFLFVKDITLQRQQWNALKKIERMYEIAFKTNPDSVAITDFEGTFIEVNQGFCRIFGWDTTEVLGRTAPELGFWVDPEEREQMFEHILKNGYVSNLEVRMRRKDGSIIAALASFTPITLNNKPHNLSVIRDITHRTQREEELRVAKLKAEESERLKSTFLANLSHEVRTPLNAIMGMAELLLDGSPPNSENSGFLEIILERSGDLLSLMNNIIELSMIEAGQVHDCDSEVSVNELLHDVHVNVASTLKQKPDVEWVVQTEEAIHITTDSEKLTSILKHLTDNALKFTDQGKVEITAASSPGGFVEFTISDTGIGIEESKQAKIFDRFQRIEGDESIKRGGAGIGLAIAKSYVEALGGTIRLKSEWGKGTTIKFVIKNRKNQLPAVDEC